MPSDENGWVDTDPTRAYSWEEKWPYNECPNCGRYEYRKLRMFRAGLIRTLLLRQDPYYTVYSACKQCKYSTEKKRQEA